MSKTGSAAKVKLSSFDDLFGRQPEEKMDMMDDVNAYIEIIKENIEYDHYMRYGDTQDKEL